MKLPLDIQFHEDIRLLVWKPHGVLNEAALKHIMTLLEGIEASSNEPFNRFTDGQALDAIDLNFRYVFDFALFRRLSAAPRPRSEIRRLCSDLGQHTSCQTARHADRLFAAALALFTDRAAAAGGLGVPLQALSE
jgi:hypothetical protein